MDANCSVCSGHVPKPTLLVVSFGVGPNATMTVRLCEDHAHSTINAIGFIYCSVTGTSVAKLLGVRERKPAAKRARKAAP
jgi:hypothetical protein